MRLNMEWSLIISVTELPVASPLIHGIVRSLSSWQDLIKEELTARGPAPPDYIPGNFFKFQMSHCDA